MAEAQWATPSQCEGWTVRDVLAHMTATANMTPAAFFPKLIGSGFSFDKVQAKGIANERGASGADAACTVPGRDRLGEEAARAKGHRPGRDHHPLRGHPEVARLKRQYPDEVLVEIADFYKGSNLIIGTKRRIDGVTLRATDTSWSHGSGPEVAGPMLPLLLAMAGRKGALDELSGDGVATLRERP